MRFGICCGPGSFATQVVAQPLSSLSPLLETLHALGADYVEFAVGAVSPEEPASTFALLKNTMQSAALKAEAFNSFIPRHLPLTGPEAQTARALEFSRVALPRCKELGGTVVVLGSGAARKFPAGFDPARALAQFVDFCRKLGPIAADAGIDIAIEPLNRHEDNICISVKHGAELVDEIAHPRILLLADLFHMDEEREPYDVIALAGPRLRHAHVADLGRVAPGYAAQGEADFTAFFRNLRAAGYDDACPFGRVSFEGRFESIEAQSGPVLALMKKRWQESA